MADPISIIGAVGAVATIIDVVGKSIKCINALRHRCKEADLTFLSLVSQLTALRLALAKIQNWMNDYSGVSHHQLVMDLNNSISYCQLLVTRLDMFVNQLNETTDGPLELSSRMKLVFGSHDVEYVQKLVERQTGVLTLLLTACDKTSIEQKVLLEKPKTRKAFGQAKIDSESLWVHRDTDSLKSRFSDNLSKLSMTFEFDHKLFSSKVYERVVRGSVKEALRRQQAAESRAINSKWSECIDHTLRKDRQLRRSEWRVIFLGSDQDEKNEILRMMETNCWKEGFSTEQAESRHRGSRTDKSGIFESKFTMRGTRTMRLIDVVGPMSTLKKCAHVFQADVNAVVFVVNLASQLAPSLTLFDFVVNSRWFARSPVILFLSNANKFRQTVETSSFKPCFTDYPGSNGADRAAKSVLLRFEQLNRTHHVLHHYFIDASDPSNVRQIYNSISCIKMQEAFSQLA